MWARSWIPPGRIETENQLQASNLVHKYILLYFSIQYTPYSIIDHTFTLHRLVSFFLPVAVPYLAPRSVGSKSRQDDRRDHCGGGGDRDVIGSGDDLGGAIAVIYIISEGGFALLAFIF